MVVRDDQFAGWRGEPAKRWHGPNQTGDSTTWAETCRIAEANEDPVTSAVLMLPRVREAGRGSVRGAILAQLDEWDALPWECIRLTVRALRVVLELHGLDEDGMCRYGCNFFRAGDCATVQAVADALRVTGEVPGG
jgi:hypothetical protein